MIRIVTDGRAQYRPVNEGQRPIVGRMTGGDVSGGLGKPSDRDLIAFMRRRGPLSGSELAEWMRVPYKVARDRLQVLRAIGQIRHEGGLWHVVTHGTSGKP